MRKHEWIRTVSVALSTLVIVIAATYFISVDQLDRRNDSRLASDVISENIGDQIRSDEDSEIVESVESEDEADDKAKTDRLEEAARKAELDSRKENVELLEERVFTTATERYETGYYEDPVLEASCMPVTGSNIEALDEVSTSFSCLAITDERDDGTRYGYEIAAVINWNTGEMTWG